jgi:hypothetical protein
MKPTTQVRLLELRNLLQQISHISFTFSKINREYPMETMTEETAKEVEFAYLELLKQASVLGTNFNLKYGKSNTTT